MERATGAELYGCGSPQSSDITLNIQTTTGGNFSISLNGKNTVEHLKKLVSKKLKVSKDRICLLHRERQLRDGTLEENGVLDGSRVILLPSVETGLLSQRPENSVMQALESLNDTQVNDFLSGKSPLNLTMRLGDHMMLIQLQLSTLNSGSSGSSRTIRTSNSAKTSTSTSKTDKEPSSQQATVAKSESTTDNTKESRAHHILQRHDIELLQNTFNLYQAMAEEKFGTKAETEKVEVMDTSHSTESDVSEATTTEDEQSPIKSLSNLVASPIAEKEPVPSTSPKKSDITELLNLNNEIPSTSAMSDKPCPSTPSLTPDSSLDSDNFTDQSSFLTENPIDEYPMENLFNSVVDKGLFKDQDESMMDREISNLATTSHGLPESSSGTLPSFQSLNEPLKNKRFQYLLHKTSKFKHPIGQNKQKAFMQSVVNKHKKRMQIRQDSHLAQPSTSQTEPYTRKLVLQPSNDQSEDNPVPSTSKAVSITETSKKIQRASPTPPVDTKALIEASKNLTQKLKKLSKEVLTNKIDLRTAEEAVRSKLGQGAVIESMKHHGKGIYSGTFSGTLNPALQDRYGRPKRDISTIIHILNDLLCAAPPITLSQKESCGSVSPVVADEECLCVSDCVCGAGRACPACRLEPRARCNDCEHARTRAIDNNKTKCKLEHLRLVMQQKKQRREARKKNQPYPSPAKTIAAQEPPPPRQEEIDTVA